VNVKTSKLVFELAFTLGASLRPVLTRARVFDEKTYYVARMLVEAKLFGQIAKSRYLWVPYLDGREQHRVIPVFQNKKGRQTWCETSFDTLVRRYLFEQGWLELDSFGRLKSEVSG
jgi:hypothetical protein